MNRYVIFGITILLGLVAGLYFVWGGSQAEVRNAAPELLREDFRADYALMVAEAFQVDSDVERAIEQLAFLDAEDPLVPMEEALDFAQKAGYDPADIALLEDLATALRAFDPSLGTTPAP